jgi:hypothetical protein
MDWQIAIPGSAGSTCRLVKTFWLGRLRLYYRGRQVNRSQEAGKPFLIVLPEGRTARLVVKGNGMDYLPKVEIDGKPYPLGRPLSTLEYLLGGLPLLLMFMGGAIGGLAGGVGAVFNYRLMRTNADTAVKTAGVLGITLASAVVYVVLVLLFQAMVGK